MIFKKKLEDSKMHLRTSQTKKKKNVGEGIHQEEIVQIHSWRRGPGEQTSNVGIYLEKQGYPLISNSIERKEGKMGGTNQMIKNSAASIFTLIKISLVYPCLLNLFIYIL